MVVINELDSLTIRLEIQADDMSAMAPSTEIVPLQNQVFPDIHDHNLAASQNSDAKDDDESSLAYARRHRLTTDYLRHDPYASMRAFTQSFHEALPTFKHPPR